jgi:hypothetical protein
MATVQKITVQYRTDDRATLVFLDLEPAVKIGFRFRHAARIDRWYMWLVSTDGEEFAGPIRLVPGIDLLAPYKYDSRVPQGQLFVQGGPLNRDNVDVGNTLRYRSVANL